MNGFHYFLKINFVYFTILTYLYINMTGKKSGKKEKRKGIKD